MFASVYFVEVNESIKNEMKIKKKTISLVEEIL